MRFTNETLDKIRTVSRTHIFGDEVPLIRNLMPGESCEVPGGGTYRVEDTLRDPNPEEIPLVQAAVAAMGAPAVEVVNTELTDEERAAIVGSGSGGIGLTGEVLNQGEVNAAGGQNTATNGLGTDGQSAAVEMESSETPIDPEVSLDAPSVEAVEPVVDVPAVEVPPADDVAPPLSVDALTGQDFSPPTSPPEVAASDAAVAEPAGEVLQDTVPA
jgi:hypothetical protein